MNDRRYPPRSPGRRTFLASSAALAALPGAALLTRASPSLAQSGPVKLTVQLNWVRSVEFAGIWWAMEHDLYKAERLDIAIRDWSPTIEPAQAVATGIADIGLVSNGLSLATARSNGLPVKAIGTFFQRTAAGLVSKKDRNILKPADLIGKTVGIPQTGRVTWDVFATANGLKDKVQMRVVGFDLTPLLTDQVDALLGFSTNQPITLAAQNVPTNFMFFADFSAPRYDDVIFTSDQKLQNSSEVIVAWLRATRKGWQGVFANKAEAVRLTVEKYGKQLIAKQQASVLDEQVRLMESDQTRRNGLFAMDRGLWDESIGIMKKAGILPAAFNGDELISDILSRV